MSEAKAVIIAAIIGAIASLLTTILTVYQPMKDRLTSDNATLTSKITQLSNEIAQLEEEKARLQEQLNASNPVSPDKTKTVPDIPSGGAVAISSASGLYSHITENMSGSFYLTQDIDMTDKDWNDKWTPLGRKSDSQAVAFTGTLDGRGYAIRGVQNSGGSFGLFEILSGTVRNLHIDAQFNYGNNARGGAFAVSMTEDGAIENCYVSGNMKFGYSSTVGSFVGNADKGSVSNCLSTLNFSFTTSSVVGGMIGEASKVTFTNCFFRSEKYQPYSPFGIDNAYSGGVIGKASDCVIHSCHYYYGGTSSEIPARLRQQVTYTDWDWGVWAINGDVNDGFPYLRTFETEFQKA